LLLTRRSALLLPLAGGAAAQTAIQKRGREIVNASLAALGGDRFLAMEDRLEAGRLYTFYREQLSGMTHARIYTRYYKPEADDDLAIRERQSLGKDKETYAYLLTEKEGLEITFRGVRPMPQETFERFKDSTLRNIFYILRQRLHEKGLIFEYKETTTFQNAPVEIVNITDSDNRVVTVYFHRSTKLPLRQVYIRRDEQRRVVEEVSIFNKYRDSNGVQWPWSVVKYRDGSRTFEMYSNEVQINPKLDDTLFRPPEGAERLKPA
jgi:hypothetical protein